MQYRRSIYRSILSLVCYNSQYSIVSNAHANSLQYTSYSQPHAAHGTEKGKADHAHVEPSAS